MSAAEITIGILVNCVCFLSSADFFQNNLFLKKSFSITIRVSNGLDPEQARPFVGPDLDPNCFRGNRPSTILGKELRGVLLYFLYHHTHAESFKNNGKGILVRQARFD